MGRVTATVTIQNYGDMLKAHEGLLPPDQIRSVELEALVDTGAAYLCLPPEAIAQLGLSHALTRPVRTANGVVERRVFKGADVTVLDRNEQMSVMENDQTTPPLLGYLVLEALDFVVDPGAEKLIPNPEHGGKWVTDLF